MNWKTSIAHAHAKPDKTCMYICIYLKMAFCTKDFTMPQICLLDLRCKTSVES